MNNTENAEKQFVTKKEFCEICGISESTAYKLIKSKKIDFEKKRDGLLHYYDIPIQETERYKFEKEYRGILSESQISDIKKYYRAKMQDYPDVICANDIRAITGYGKEIIRKWIISEKILGIVVRKKFRIAKEDLIDFLASPYYARIHRKSQTHISDFQKLEIIQ